MAEDTLGQRIRKLRSERGLSLAKVAGADFSRAFLNQVELGKSQPSTRVLRVIAERLEAPLEYLISGEQRSAERELALEKGRVALARGQARKALLELGPALGSRDWPLGSDARVCAAEALLALGRAEEALPLLEAEQAELRSRGDAHRLRRLRAVRERRPHTLSASGHLRLGELAQREGRLPDALEHYRCARVLFESAAAGGRAAS